MDDDVGDVSLAFSFAIVQQRCLDEEDMEYK